MKMLNQKRAFALFTGVLITLALSQPARAQTVLVDFETYPGPDGSFGTLDDIPAPPCGAGDICGPLSNEFSSFGMTFSRGTLGTPPLFPDVPATNHYITSTPPDATFSRPVTGISITSNSYWTATLYALDSAGAILGSDTLVHPSPGSSFFLGTLSVTTTEPIARFTVLAAGCSVGGPCSQILNLDDLALTAPTPRVPAMIPALSAWGVAGLAALLAAIGWVALSRRPAF